MHTLILGIVGGCLGRVDVSYFGFQENQMILTETIAGTFAGIVLIILFIRNRFYKKSPSPPIQENPRHDILLNLPCHTINADRPLPFTKYSLSKAYLSFFFVLLALITFVEVMN